MQALKLSEMYYHEICVPMLEKSFPELVGRLAAGLVGEGSECFGFDDETSRDHDWGAAVCFWLGKADHEKIGARLQQELELLPQSFYTYPVRQPGRWSAGRTGVLEIGQFYFRYIGHGKVPENLMDWLRIPEQSLATATNGRVFVDAAGEFTAFRQALLDFYPECVRRKKIAARCAKAAQAGQYNLPRCIKRKEYVAATLAAAEFIDAVCSLVFLLNKRYRPFYKWAHRAMYSLPILGQKVATLLAELARAEQTEGERANPAIFNKKQNIIEEISALLIYELARQELSDSASDFLLEHAVSVQDRIKDASIKKIDVFLG